jgi:hypothetical protein
MRRGKEHSILSADQIIDEAMARSVQANAARTHPHSTWVVTRDEGTYRGKFVARLVTNAPTAYVLLAYVGRASRPTPAGDEVVRSSASRPAGGRGNLVSARRQGEAPRKDRLTPAAVQASQRGGGRDGSAAGAPRQVMPGTDEEQWTPSDLGNSSSRPPTQVWPSTAR